MTRNWKAIGHTLQVLMHRCAEIAGPLPAEWATLSAADLATALRVAEARERPGCDKIMRQLLRTESVRTSSTPIPMHFCSMRCMCALDTLGILHAPPPLYPEPPAEWSDPQLLEWLLLSNWLQRHESWLKLMAFGLATGRTFYSG